MFAWNAGNMSKLYILTHGETTLGQDRIHGQKVDAPLTRAGRQTVNSSIPKLMGKGITKVYHSPLKRATETAGIMGKALGVPTESRSELMPWDVGSMSGAKTNSIKPVLDFFSSRPDRSIPSGESKGSFLKRYSGFVKGLKGTVAIAGHSQHSLGLKFAQGGEDAAKVRVLGGKPGEITEANL
jgi:broad specificity phosphatase PhoE